MPCGRGEGGLFVVLLYSHFHDADMLFFRNRLSPALRQRELSLFHVYVLRVDLRSFRLKNLRAKCPDAINGYVACLDANSQRFEACRKEVCSESVGGCGDAVTRYTDYQEEVYKACAGGK